MSATMGHTSQSAAQVFRVIFGTTERLVAVAGVPIVLRENENVHNTQRVFARMLDGMWHHPDYLRNVGGSDAIRRVRSLRENWIGSMKVDRKRHGRTGLFLYRLDLSTVTEEIKERIRKWDFPRPMAAAVEDRAEHNFCTACNGTGVMDKSVSDEQLTLI